MERFLRKGYPWKLIANELDRAKKYNRSSLLAYKQQKSDSDRIPMVYKFHPSILHVNKQIKREWSSLVANPDNLEIFPKPPICAYTQPCNLNKLLVRSKLPASPSNGNQICNKPRCQICKLLVTDNIVKPPGTNITLRPGKLNCDSENVVYLIMCKKCNKGNYVGETTTKFRYRMNNHKHTINTKQTGFPVANHFSQLGHSINDLKCVLLKGGLTSLKERRISELQFIFQLNSHNTGLNRDLSILSHYSWFAK